MRIIAGKYRGRKLLEFKGKDIRPTSDKAREALFSILQNRVYDASFLDLFAGTGGVGFEAMSRGAAKCVMCDSAATSCQLIKQNAEHLGAEVEVYNIPALYALNKFIDFNTKFDMIFLDPPYKTSYGFEALKIIADNKILNEDGVIIFEESADVKTADKKIDGLIMYDKRKYGTAVFRFYKYGEEEIETEE